MRHHKHRGQMSEALLTAAFLSLSGGLQDAYTYIARGEVFANAQTGNIVLLSQNLFTGNWAKVPHYLVPLVFFALGIAAAEGMRYRFQQARRIHWRQLVLLEEIVTLFAVGLMPASLNMLANAIVSFSCAMQVQAFRKVNGYAFASTMCIGNLRSVWTPCAPFSAPATASPCARQDTISPSSCFSPWALAWAAGASPSSVWALSGSPAPCWSLASCSCS